MEIDFRSLQSLQSSHLGAGSGKSVGNARGWLKVLLKLGKRFFWRCAKSVARWLRVVVLKCGIVNRYIPRLAWVNADPHGNLNRDILPDCVLGRVNERLEFLWCW